MVDITRTSRYTVTPGIDFQWSNLWSYNIFRVYEFIFGRKNKIKLQSRSMAYKIDGQTFHVQELYTLESCLVYAEYMVRKFFSPNKFGFKFVPIPQYAIIGVDNQVPLFRFAIAFDATSHNQNATTNALTISHTNAGSGESDVLFVQNRTGSGNNDVTGCTDNGTSMTQLQNVINLQSNNNTFSIFGLTVAPSGTTNIVINASTSIVLLGVVLSYSGTNQTSAFDTSAIVSTAATSSTSTTLVTNGANEVIVSNGINGSSVTQTWGANLRYTDNIFTNGIYVDKTIATATTTTISYSGSVNDNWIISSVSLKSPGGGAINSGFFFAASR